jgi:hypothetical protein
VDCHEILLVTSTSLTVSQILLLAKSPLDRHLRGILSFIMFHQSDATVKMQVDERNVSPSAS